MTNDEILALAREAGLVHFWDSEGDFSGITDVKLIVADAHRNDDRLVEILAPFATLVAELIVQECVGIAYEHDAPKMSGPGMIIAGRIEKHFGVQ